MSKKLLEIAGEIVQTQVASSPLTSEDIVSSLRQVFCALQEMQKVEAQGMGAASEGATDEAVSVVKMDPKDSIQNDKIICLECGAEMRQLTARHLKMHGLNLREYKKKYGFTLKQPLSAKSLTRIRTKLAKKRGLPANLLKYLEERRQGKTGSEAPVEASSPSAPEAPKEGKSPARSSRRKKLA